MKNTISRIITIRTQNTNELLYSNIIFDVSPAELTNIIYTEARRLAKSYKTDVKVVEAYIDGGSDGETYVYYEDIVKKIKFNKSIKMKRSDGAAFEYIAGKIKQIAYPYYYDWDYEPTAKELNGTPIDCKEF